MKKIKNKGFTLAELLVVIAIIAILVAIAVPVFSAQLEKAREGVDRSDARAAQEMAYAEYMLNHGDDTAAVGAITYTFGKDSKENLFILSHTSTVTPPPELNNCDLGWTAGTDDPAAFTAHSKVISKNSDEKVKTLTVIIEDGKVTSNNWLEVLNN